MARSSWQVQETSSWKREWFGRFVPGYWQVAGNGWNESSLEYRFGARGKYGGFRK